MASEWASSHARCACGSELRGRPGGALETVPIRADRDAQCSSSEGKLTPIAGVLVANSYSRKEEYQADQHGVVLLRCIGQPKEAMINTLTWLMLAEGGSGSAGFFATHPATGDRIEALRRM